MGNVNSYSGKCLAVTVMVRGHHKTVNYELELSDKNLFAFLKWKNVWKPISDSISKK